MKIKKFLKILFILYCFILIYVLFCRNHYRHGFQYLQINTFSREHIEMCNFTPFETISNYLKRLSDHLINTDIVIVNLVANLLLFVPMGFFVPILFKEKIDNFLKFLLLIILLTVGVETIQFLSFTGSTDIDDVILNTFGAIAMYLIMKTKLATNLLDKAEKVFE